MEDSNPNKKVIKISGKLNQAFIIKELYFDFENTDIVVELRKDYDNKKIASHLDLEGWQDTINTFKETLIQNGVSKKHAAMICDNASKGAVELIEEEGGKWEKEQNRKHEVICYKYSSNIKEDLHEAVILDNKPVFITYNGKKIVEVKSIKEESRAIVPPLPEEYPYSAYQFKNIGEVNTYLERAKKISFDAIYFTLKPIVADYNDQTKHKQILLTTDIIWSYFQDRFPTTRYNIIVGGNGSGKSTEAIFYGATGYRPVNFTNPNAANINRILGCVEPGQCTIISDETRGLDKNPDLLSTYAEGYRFDGQTSKINDYTRKNEFFKAYCYKILVAETVPKIRELKGIVDRSFDDTAYMGHPKYDIKETLTPQGNPARQRRMNVLNDFRKLMLIYRLLHFKDSIPDIDVGVDGREKELVKPNLQLFHNTEAQKEIIETLQYYLSKRRGKKDVSIEPILHKIVTGLCKSSQQTIPVKDIWEKLKCEIPGHVDVERDRDGVVIEAKRPNEYHTQDFGTIYCNSTVANILEHTFGGSPKHTKTGNAYIFDRERLQKVSSSLKRTLGKIKVGEEGEQGEDDTKASYFDCMNSITSSSNNKQNIHMLPKTHSSYSPLHLDEVERKLKERSEALAERGSGEGGIA